jgi:hypothetical protein
MLKIEQTVIVGIEAAMRDGIEGLPYSCLITGEANAD